MLPMDLGNGITMTDMYLSNGSLYYIYEVDENQVPLASWNDEVIANVKAAIINELKTRIIEALKLADLKPEDIDADAPLFGEGLGLDSIDALELMLLLEKNYGIKLKNPAEGKEVFKSVRTMAEYIQANQAK